MQENNMRKYKNMMILLLTGVLCFSPATRLFGYEEDDVYAGIYVDPQGCDQAEGTQDDPFQTLFRARQSVRERVEDMQGHIVVHVAPGDYRLERPFELTDADSGRNGFRVIYRSQGGPGRARILGSKTLENWSEYRDGIWKHPLPSKEAPGSESKEVVAPHTIYENGRRAVLARFPNYEHDPDKPVASGPYFLTEDGIAEPKEGDDTSWFTYRPEDAPPVTDVRTMEVVIFEGGRRDWFRRNRKVSSISPDERLLEFHGTYRLGTGEGARYFFQNEIEFLEEPGEFYVDRDSSLIYYKPRGSGHPDELGISVPLGGRLLELRGSSRDQPVENIVIDGLSLEETDSVPNTSSWWATGYGRDDGALIWMRNTSGIEVRNARLRNSGRSGIIMVGHNTGNLVSNSLIEHMGVNGITLSNRFTGTDDRNENNRIHNCRIGHVGELHCYAASINVFNASSNEVSHCELHDSIRYAITVRGNTGEQHGPMVTVDQPPARDNHFHHLRIFRTGQDSGDMGALHAANLNVPDGESINTFEQITVADTRAIPSMQDWAPDGIFLDWPEMAMHQVFRNIHITRSQGMQIRSNGPENFDSARTENVSWLDDFDESLMDSESIGLTPEFPEEYGGRGALYERPSEAPKRLVAEDKSHERVMLSWDPPEVAEDEDRGAYLVYSIFRDGELLDTSFDTFFSDESVAENTTYSYSVKSTRGASGIIGAQSEEITVKTDIDRTPLELLGAANNNDLTAVALVFNKAVDASTAAEAGSYSLTSSQENEAPGVESAAVCGHEKSIVLLSLDARLSPDTEYVVRVENVEDKFLGKPVEAEKNSAVLIPVQPMVHYTMEQTREGKLADAGPHQRHGRLKGAAGIKAGGGRRGDALDLRDSDAWVEAPEDLNFGRGDFTLSGWFYYSALQPQRTVILSKGQSWASPQNWSFGTLSLHSLAGLSLRSGDKRYCSEAKLESSQWVHVALVREGDLGIYYIDGEPVSEVDLSGAGPFENEHPLIIGRRPHEPNPWPFPGLIDDLRIYDRGLDGPVIRALKHMPWR